MNNEEIKELHGIIEEYLLSRGYGVKKSLSFLTTVFVGTMEMHGFSDEFFDATCDRMKLTFRDKRYGLGRYKR